MLLSARKLERKLIHLSYNGFVCNNIAKAPKYQEVALGFTILLEDFANSYGWL